MSVVIYKVLDVSTAHLSPAERRDLACGALEYQIMTGEYGGLLWVSEDMNDPEWSRPEVMSETQVEILRFAFRCRCNYVKYDADADLLDGVGSWDEDGQWSPWDGEFDVEREMAGES